MVAGLGFTAGSLLCKTTLDRYIKRRTKRGNMRPEHRLPPTIFAGLVIPIGLLWYGWTVERRTHWIAPIIGTAILGLGVISTIVSTFTYFVDAFGIHSASAIAANICLRCISGAFLPLVAPPLYKRFGYGWGNSILGFTALAFLPVPIALMRYGERIRVQANVLATI